MALKCKHEEVRKVVLKDFISYGNMDKLGFKTFYIWTLYKVYSRMKDNRDTATYVYNPDEFNQAEIINGLMEKEEGNLRKLYAIMRENPKDKNYNTGLAEDYIGTRLFLYSYNCNYEGDTSIKAPSFIKKETDNIENKLDKERKKYIKMDLKLSKDKNK